MLEEAGVLESEKEGRSVFYTVRYGPLAETLHALADAIEACCPDGKNGARHGECCAKR
jgi:DNA-binding transcriptional ArsR family regulator